MVLPVLPPHLCFWHSDLFTPTIELANQTMTSRTTQAATKVFMIAASFTHRPQRFRKCGLYMTSSRKPRMMYAPVYSVSSIGRKNRSKGPASMLIPRKNRNTVTRKINVPDRPDRVARPGDLQENDA